MSLLQQPNQQSPLHKALFDKVKRGEVEEVIRMVRESNIDCANLVDETKNFSQTPIFSACIVPDKELAFKMIKVLVELGMDPIKEDSLKQTPIFYASREGNADAINYLCSKGDSVNRQDKYG